MTAKKVLSGRMLKGKRYRNGFGPRANKKFLKLNLISLTKDYFPIIFK